MTLIGSISFVNGIGQLDDPEEKPKTKPSTEWPYLLLDVRDIEDYDAEHLYGGRSRVYFLLDERRNRFLTASL